MYLLTEKELKKLSRQELLEILLAQSKKIDRLQRQLHEAKEELNKKELNISEAGSIAEASLVLNNIFTDAQNAADQYLDNIRRMNAQAEKELAAAKAARERAEAAEAEKFAEPAEETGTENLADVAEGTGAEVFAVVPGETGTDGEIPAFIKEMSDNASSVEDDRQEDESSTASSEEPVGPQDADEPASEEIPDDPEAAEKDRQAAADYLEEIRRMKEQTERECAEKRSRTDKQIRVSLIRTKKAVYQMMNLYADEVMKRMKHLQEWDRQMEALHERKIEKRSSKSQK